MSEPVTSSTETSHPHGRLQFSLQTLAGLFVVVALLLGYLRLFGVGITAHWLAFHYAKSLYQWLQS
jgi:hypothetical protein